MLKLTTPLSEISGIPEKFLKRLVKLGVKTVKDLLWHFPSRYEDFSHIYTIGELIPGQQATIQGQIEKINVRRSWRRQMLIAEAHIADQTGVIRAVWFNQPYIASTLRRGILANFAGKVQEDDGELYLSSPAYERVRNGETNHTARLVPIYPETKGLTSKGIRFLIKPALKQAERIREWIPKEILDTQNIPEINQAIADIHFPNEIEDAMTAKKRFAFEELFLLQLFNLREREALAKEKAPALKLENENRKAISDKLPFTLTSAQERSLTEILEDLSRGTPMNRLLQGDVGSGKTVIAAIAALAATGNGYQSAFMAPTEVLARQHFETLKKLFSPLPQKVSIALITGSGAKIFYENNLGTETTKKNAKFAVERGEINIVIGTHALIQKDIKFRNLGLVVIDEQHRFGVRQRQALSRRLTQIEETPINADTNTTEDDFLYKNLTYKIRGALFTVANTLGYGLKEIVYQKALEAEFRNLGINFKKEPEISITYKDKRVGVYRPDFIVDDSVIVELKALSFVGGIENKQIWSYLKNSECKLGLLVNFGSRKVDVKRIVLDTARKNLRQSASSNRRESALVPHLLSMSATPIPRTLTLTIFGDLDLSIINEMPGGRKPIITKIVDPANRDKAYAFIRGQVQNGRQIFVICPRIESSDAADDRRESASHNLHKSALLWADVKNVTEEYEKLSKKIFPDLRVAMLHGKLKPKEKMEIMQKFSARGGSSSGGQDEKIDILVSTSVIEVGVDVPNATIMMIESADRFGLAQLYQFRGRVGRGEHQSFCLLFTESSSESTKNRLTALIDAKNGFELAEMDLKLRGPGEFLGVSQTGMPDIAMRALQNMELIKEGRTSAEAVLVKSPDLKKYPALSAKLAEFKFIIHPE